MFLFINIHIMQILMQIDNEIELIVAFSKNNVLGNQNKLPWNIPEDLKRFKDLTTNHIVVMGRKTFESLPNGPLKNRINIVFTNQITNKKNSNVVYTNMENFCTTINELNVSDKKIFIIGGSEIYKIFLHSCKKIHITYIDAIFEGDVYFPFELSYFFENYEKEDSNSITLMNPTNIKYHYYIFIKT